MNRQNISNVKSLLTNYRPISLLSCFGKVFEKHLNNQFQQHININNLLRKFHNCVTAVSGIHDFILSKMDKKRKVIGISKAFYCLNHKIILLKKNFMA